MSQKMYKVGDLVKVKSRTSIYKGAIGTVLGYCNGDNPDILRVKISDKVIINLYESSVESTGGIYYE